jgi:cytochrome b6-f complex iron-sulfur subunit
MQRRKFLNWLGLSWLVTIVTARFAAPTHAATPAKKPKFVLAGTAAALQKAGTLSVTINDKTIVTVFPNPTNPKQLLAMNLACTHNGCTVNWNGAAKTFKCPCHGAEYAVDGKVLKAPATKGLAIYPVQRQGKNILVQVS